MVCMTGLKLILMVDMKVYMIAGMKVQSVELDMMAG